MPRIVLRLLLCLSLVLNGSGYVVAATQMEMAHWAMEARAIAQAQPPCHAANDVAIEQAMPSHQGMATGVDTPVDPHGTTPDCCQSALCTCDCLQHATAASTVAAIASGMPPARYTASPGDTRPLAPPFHAPLRPPIA